VHQPNLLDGKALPCRRGLANAEHVMRNWPVSHRRVRCIDCAVRSAPSRLAARTTTGASVRQAQRDQGTKFLEHLLPAGSCSCPLRAQQSLSGTSDLVGSPADRLIHAHPLLNSVTRYTVRSNTLDRTSAHRIPCAHLMSFAFVNRSFFCARQALQQADLLRLAGLSRWKNARNKTRRRQEPSLCFPATPPKTTLRMPV